MKRQITQNIKSIMLAMVLVWGVSYVSADWTAPNSTAPTCVTDPTAPGYNPACSAPLNVGTSAQTKAGYLSISYSTTSYALSVPNGSTWLNGLGVGSGGIVSAGIVDTAGGLIIQRCATGLCPGDAGRSAVTGQMWIVTP